MNSRLLRLSQRLMDKEGGLFKAKREMIVVTTSSANQCQYCVIAHGAILEHAFIA